MVNLSEQVYRWRQKLDRFGKANFEKKVMSYGMKFLMEHPERFHAVLRFAPMANRMPRVFVYNFLNAWGKEREMPRFAKQTFEKWWRERLHSDTHETA